MAERQEQLDVVVPIGRTIDDFRKNARESLTDERDRITAAWSMGQYFHPDTAYELFDNIDYYDLWDNHQFTMFAPFQWIGPRIARLAVVYDLPFLRDSSPMHRKCIKLFL